MISKYLTAEQVSGAKRLIDGARRVVILTHMSPDGDAMGSSLGMYHYLCAQPQVEQVTVVVPNEFPAFLAWLPGVEHVVVYEQQPEQAAATIAAADLVVCTDFGETRRVGAVEPLLCRAISNAQHSLVIDHHLHPTMTPDVLISYPEASSASELVFRLIWQLNALVSLDFATCVYCGIMTDTGNFQFSCADPELYEIVAELLRTGIDKIDIYDRVFNSYSEDRLRLTGYCLNRKMQLYAIPNSDIKVALIALDRKEQYRFNFQSGDAEGIVNMPMQITEVKYSCFMREDKDKIKISLRSQGDRPVNVFAHDIFSGGGHMNASGGEFHDTLDAAVQAFLKNYKTYLK